MSGATVLKEYSIEEYIIYKRVRVKGQTHGRYSMLERGRTAAVGVGRQEKTKGT